MEKKLLQKIAPARTMLLLTILCALLATLATIAQMGYVSKIVSRVFLAHQSLEQVGSLLLFLLIAIFIRAVLLWLRELAAQQGAIRVKIALRKSLFRQLLQLGPAFSRGERTGELVLTLSEGIERLDAYVSRYLPQMFLSVLIPLLIVAVLFPLDWTSALLLLLTAPLIPLLMVLVGSYTEKHIQQQWTALARMSAHFLDSVQGLMTLKLFGRSRAECERIERMSNSFRDRTMRVLRLAFLSGTVLEFMVTMAIGLVAVTLGIRLLNHGISFENAFLILLLTPEFYRPLRDLGTHRHAGMEGKAAAQRMLEILEMPVAMPKAERSAGLSCSALEIDFTGVSYLYPNITKPALHNISLSLAAGTCTALVGRSGAGKSTLVNLLLRFIEPSAGQISVNGISLAALGIEEWRKYVALVPQRPYLFYGSIEENIRMARPEASDEEVLWAARQAGASDFIQRLPAGFATQIGEQGKRLSAGQAQRIALARAFLKDAPLLLLDEPASSLDPESEALIRQALERLQRDRTVVIVAHRYSTVAHADQVVVLEKGEIIEIGKPAALLQGDSTYARLMGKQSGEVSLR
ncbi:thiol reductant ABC exporter subunit CydD [Ktedonosporobacter rubrisoli]|uniref:thiol reductant ABC exporter subunit CydD n=1 Tax=Ktedonosporobacter rubrisoli TaxID=2509675 RepID=UPI0013EE7321|nr:thiol reductant ABC exporter subunit CydD [Ktedonosporobacter rubrisoli]